MRDYEYGILTRTILQEENIPAEAIKGKSCLIIGDAAHMPDMPDFKCCTELVTDYLLERNAASCTVLGERFDPLRCLPIPENVEFKQGHLKDLSKLYGQRQFDLVFLLEGLEKCHDLYSVAQQVALCAAGV